MLRFVILRSVLEFLTCPFRLVLGPILRLTDKRLALQRQREFERELRRDAAFLFTERQATIIANEGVPFPPPFDGAFVTIQADGLILRFERGRGDFNVRVASKDKPFKSTDLDVLIAAIEHPEDVHRSGFANSLCAAEALERNWGRLKRAVYSQETEAALLDFDSREEAVRKAAERELNRRLYGK